MKKLWKFLGNIVSTGNDASSKRLYALWSMVIITAIVTYGLIRSEVSASILSMFYALLGLVTALAGVATIQAIKNNGTKKKEE